MEEGLENALFAAVYKAKSVVTEKDKVTLSFKTDESSSVKTMIIIREIFGLSIKVKVVIDGRLFWTDVEMTARLNLFFITASNIEYENKEYESKKIRKENMTFFNSLTE